MPTPATLQEMLATVKKLRDEVPTFDPNVDGNKEKIEYFHQALHTVVLSIQQEVGFIGGRRSRDYRRHRY